MNGPETPASGGFRARHADRRPYLAGAGPDRRPLRALVRQARASSRWRPAALQVSPGNETHLHAFATGLIGPDSGAARAAICGPRRNSPARSCWPPARPRSSISPGCSANRERGALHHPEFTMLEWYRANERYEALMDDCGALLAEAARARGDCGLFSFRGRTIDPFAAAGTADGGGSFRCATPALICWRTICGGQGDRDGAGQSRGTSRRRVSRRRTTGATSSAAFWPRGSSRISAMAARRYYMNIRCRQAALARAKPGSRQGGRALRALCLRR